jgi:importin subunit alpha-6/7
MWALTNIASGNTEQVATLIDGGVIPLIVRLLKGPSLDVTEQASWALGNIAGDSVEYRNLVLEAGVMIHFASLDGVTLSLPLSPS